MSEKNKFIDKFKEKIKEAWGVEGEFTFEKLRKLTPKEPIEVKADNLSSNDFLKFATIDYQALNNPKALVDCLSNCKRALMAKLDELIDDFGLSKLSKKKNWSFNNKYDLISKCGIITPKILAQVNTLRNKLEHDYQTPKKEEVEEVYEITALFISYANSIPSFELPVFNFEFDNVFKVFLEDSVPEFKFFEREDSNGKYKSVCTIHHEEPEFKELLQFFIKLKKATKYNI